MTESRRNIFAVILIAALGCIVYANSLNNGFLYDDEQVVESNDFLSSWSNIRYFDTPRYFSGSGEETYRPGVTLSYFFDSIRGHGKTAAFHQTSLALHIACGILLYFFLLDLIPFLDRKRDPALIALFAALLFVAHPAQTEAVDSIGFREELIYTAFSLLALLSFAAYRHRTQRRFLILSALSYLLALLSKESALPLIAIIVLTDLYRRKDAAANRSGPEKFKLSHYAWHLTALLIYVYIRFVWMVKPGVLGSAMPGTGHPGGSLYTALLTSSRIFMNYLSLLALPIKLSAEGYYRYIIDPSRSILEPRTAASVAALAALAAFTLRNLWKHRLFSFCVLWFFIWLAPAANIMPLNQPYAERYLYAATAGFCLFLAAMLVHPHYFTTRETTPAGPSRTKPLFIVLVPVLIGYSILTFNRNKIWSDRLVFWREITMHPPATARAYANLGFAHFKRGMFPEAIAAYQQAIKINPYDDDAHKKLSEVYLDMNDYDSAQRYAETALRLRPDKAIDHKLLDAAAGSAQTSVRLYSEGAMNHNQLGRVFLRRQEYARAREQFQAAIRLDPFLSQAYNNLAIGYFKEGRYDNAIEQYRRALEFNPRLGSIHINIGLAYAAKNDWPHAEESFTQALAIEPDSAAAHHELDRLHEQMGGKRLNSIPDTPAPGKKGTP